MTADVQDHVAAVAERVAERAGDVSRAIRRAFVAETRVLADRNPAEDNALEAAAARYLDLGLRFVVSQPEAVEVDTAVARLIDALPHAMQVRDSSIRSFVQIAARILQRQLIEEATALKLRHSEGLATLRQVATASLAFSSRVTAAVLAARLAVVRREPSRDHRPRDMFGDLLRNAPTLTDARLRRAGIVLGDLNVAVVAKALPSSDDSMAGDPATLAKWLSRVTETPGHQPTIEAFDDRAVVVVPMVSHRAERDLVVTLHESVATSPSLENARVAVGPTSAGIAGVSESYARATEVLELQTRHRRLDAILSYEAAIPYLMLERAPAAAMKCRDRLVRPLEEHDAAKSTQLLPTLEAYLGSTGNLRSVAERLSVHRHTVYSRLERIEDLTGARPDDPQFRMLFELGLYAARIATD